MGFRVIRLPLLLLLLASPAVAMEKPEKLDGSGEAQRCSDSITKLMQTRLNRAQRAWAKTNPNPSRFEREAQHINQVVKAESIKAHALKTYECSLKLRLETAESAALSETILLGPVMPRAEEKP
jgi:hypothetical protein